MTTKTSSELLKITFFKIAKCGYFELGEDTPVAGSIDQILSSLERWSQTTHNIEQTKTFTPSEDSDILPVYLLDIRSHNGDWLITTWNETPKHKGKVESVSLDQKIGTVTTESTNIKGNSIPGFATYFWFLPSENLLATIRITNTHNGQRGLQKYIEAFMMQSPDFTESTTKSDGTIHRVVSIKSTKHDDEEPVKLTPFFRTNLKVSPGKKNDILRKWDKIRRVTRKTELEMVGEAPKNNLQSYLSLVGFKTHARKLENIKVKLEMTASPTKTELEDMIREWESCGGSSWNDYGFSYHNDSKTDWLSKSIAKTEQRIDIQYKAESSLIHMEHLISQLSRYRNVLTADIKSDLEEPQASATILKVKQRRKATTAKST